MDKKQMGSVVVVALAILFIGASVASSKIKTLKKVSAGSITNPYLKDGAVNSAKIEDGSVSNADYADNSITTGKIADGQVNTDDLADSSVTTGKIADSAVTSAKIALGTITGSALASNIEISTTGNITAANLTTSGIIKLRKYSAQPFACDTNNDGVVALTEHAAFCVCEGSSNSWKNTHVYTACQW